MTNKSDDENSFIPCGQKLLDRPFLLLVSGVVITLVFYTLWGLIEISLLPKAPLP
jgi:hypothetical protein